MCPPPATEAGSALAAPSAFERLLGAMSRHLPETDAAGEQLLRQTLAWISQHSPPVGARATAAAAEALECGLSAAQTLADLRLDPAGLATTLLLAALPSTTLATAGLAEALGEEVAGLVEGADRLGKVRWDRLEEERAETLRKMFLA